MVQTLYSEHEGRQEEKQRRENERENQIQELLSIVARIVEEQAAARQREEEGSYGKCTRDRTPAYNVEQPLLLDVPC